MLLAIGRRPDSVEKVQRFQAVEILSRRMLEAALEYHRPIGAERSGLVCGRTWQRRQPRRPGNVLG